MSRRYDPQEIMRALEREVAEVIRADALAASSAIVLASPVGNPSLWAGAAPPGYTGGHFRRNWRVSFNNPVNGELGVAGSAGGESEGVAALGRIRAQLGRYRRPVRRVILQNNVPYGPALNAGSSLQAPAGFVERAIQAALRSRGRRTVR